MPPALRAALLPLALAGAGAAAWFLARAPKAPAPEAPAAAAAPAKRRAPARDAGKRTPRPPAPARKADARDAGARDDAHEAWMDALGPADRKLALDVGRALDADDFAAVRALVPDARASASAAVRAQMVDALAWFGGKSVAELAGFLADPDPEVARAAFTAWDGAVDQIDSEPFRVQAAVAAMNALANEDSIRQAAARLEAAEDVRAALKAATDVAVNGGESARKVARETYEFITGEKWPGDARARYIALTWKNDDADDEGDAAGDEDVKQ